MDLEDCKQYVLFSEDLSVEVIDLHRVRQLKPGRSHLSPDGGGLTRAAVHRLGTAPKVPCPDRPLANVLYAGRMLPLSTSFSSEASFYGSRLLSMRSGLTSLPRNAIPKVWFFLVPKGWIGGGG